jgi:hypothetical protein
MFVLNKQRTNASMEISIVFDHKLLSILSDWKSCSKEGVKLLGKGIVCRLEMFLQPAVSRMMEDRLINILFDLE